MEKSALYLNPDNFLNSIMMKYEPNEEDLRSNFIY